MYDICICKQALYNVNTALYLSYPLILSIEDHCSVGQQRVMAANFKVTPAPAIHSTLSHPPFLS